MPVKISTVRLFKLGLQPLLILSEASERFGMVTIYGYLAWPEWPEGRPDIEQLIKVSARFNGSPASDPDREHALNSMRWAPHEGALHRAAKLVQSHTNLTDEMTVDLVDVEKLRAWRALGLFPGNRELPGARCTRCEVSDVVLERFTVPKIDIVDGTHCGHAVAVLCYPED